MGRSRAPIGRLCYQAIYQWHNISDIGAVSVRCGERGRGGGWGRGGGRCGGVVGGWGGITLLTMLAVLLSGQLWYQSTLL